MSDPIVVDGLTLHPDMQFLLEIRARRGSPRLREMTMEQIRELTLKDSVTAGGQPAPVHAVTDLTVPGVDGPLRARLYAPAADWDTLLLFFHGGCVHLRRPGGGPSTTRRRCPARRPGRR